MDRALADAQFVERPRIGTGEDRTVPYSGFTADARGFALTPRPTSVRYAGRVLIGPYTFRRLVQARALLVSDECTSRTVSSVAEVVGLSPYHFIRQFGALYGVTPHQLRSSARIARAQELLAEGAWVTEACMGVGFSSLGSFSGMFARRVGLSPVRYRRFVQVPRTFSPLLVPGCLGLLGLVPARNVREALRPWVGHSSAMLQIKLTSVMVEDQAKALAF